MVKILRKSVGDRSSVTSLKLVLTTAHDAGAISTATRATTRHALGVDDTGSTCRNDDDCRRQSVRTTRSLAIATLVGAAAAAVPQGSHAQVGKVTFSNAACTLSGTTLSCSATSASSAPIGNVTFSNLACTLNSAGTALNCAPPAAATATTFSPPGTITRVTGCTGVPANDTAVIILAGEAAGSGNTVKFADGQNCRVNSLTLAAGVYYWVSPGHAATITAANSAGRRNICE